MPRFGLISDLHHEHEQLPRLNTEGLDALLVLGDVLTGGGDRNALDVLASMPIACPIVFVPGNHEFEFLPISEAVDQLRARATLYSDIHVLYNSSIVMAGVEFIGTTLWSAMDFSRSPPNTEERIQNTFRDFKVSRPDGSKLTVSEVRQEHHVALAYLKHALGQPKTCPRFVLTHFPPHEGSIVPQFKGNAFQPWFSNSLSPELMVLADGWMHGHTHHNFDYLVRHQGQSTHVRCNASGFTQTITLEDKDEQMKKIWLKNFPQLAHQDPLILEENPKRQFPLVIDVA